MRCIAEIVGGAMDGELHQIPEPIPCIRIPTMNAPKWIAGDEDMAVGIVEVYELVFRRDTEPKGKVGDIVIFAYRLQDE